MAKLQVAIVSRGAGADDAHARSAGWVLLAATAAWLLGTLTWHSLWNNEFITINSIRLDWGDCYRERLALSHMPGYFLMLKAWASLAGEGEFALRFPSAVFAIAAAATVWRISARLYGERPAVFALAVMGFGQTLQRLAADARMYSGLLLASALALWCVIRWREDGRRRWLAGLAAAGVLGLGFQMLFGLVAACVIAWAVSRRVWRERPIVGLGVALAIPFVVWLPVVLGWTRSQTKLRSASAFKLELWDGLREVEALFIGHPSYLHGIGWKVAMIVLLVACGAVLARSWFRHREAPESRFLGLLLLWVGMPSAAIIISSAVSGNRSVGSWRYYVTVGAAAPVLLAGAVCAARRWFGPRGGAALGFAVLGFVAAGTVAFMRDAGSGLREAALLVKAARSPGEPILAARQQAGAEAFRYYAATTEPLPVRPKAKADVAGWVRAMGEGHDSFWVVYFRQDETGPVEKAIRTEGEFARSGEVRRFGETSVARYTRTREPE